MFVTAAQVATSVAAGMHQPEGSLEDFWATVIADATTAAYDQICQRFILLGYSQAQIDAWDRGPTYQKFLARYQALIDGAGDKDQVGEWRRELDYWRGLLDKVTTIDDGGAVTDPTANDAGSVGHGNLSTSGDLFSLDPDDDRIGNPTDW